MIKPQFWLDSMQNCCKINFLGFGPHSCYCDIRHFYPTLLKFSLTSLFPTNSMLTYFERSLHHHKKQSQSNDLISWLKIGWLVILVWDVTIPKRVTQNLQSFKASFIDTHSFGDPGCRITSHVWEQPDIVKSQFFFNFWYLSKLKIKVSYVTA